VLIESATDYFIGTFGDCISYVFIEHTQRSVGQSGSLFDFCQSCDVGTLEGSTGNWEVLNRSLGLRGIKSILWDFDFTHGVAFNSVFHENQAFLRALVDVANGD
jgi:hypothetical protein